MALAELAVELFKRYAVVACFHVRQSFTQRRGMPRKKSVKSPGIAEVLKNLLLVHPASNALD